MGCKVTGGLGKPWIPEGTKCIYSLVTESLLHGCDMVEN